MASYKEDWRLCAEWLARCQILPRDHPSVVGSESDVTELAQALRDGVLICHLVNTLKPGVLDVKDFSQRPQLSQFLCQKNIRCFLYACKNSFSLRDADLFDVDDLFSLKDFKKVVKTLSKLSRSEAVAPYIPGFQSKDDDDIYKNLEDLAISDLPDDRDDIYGSVAMREPEEQIYEDLCSVMKRSSEVPKGEKPKKTKRDYCIEEMVMTERNYLDALTMIIDKFIKQLKSVFEPASVETVFINIEQLHVVHTELYSELQKAVAAGYDKIPAVFVRMKKKLVGYGEYCSNLLAAQNHLDELTKKSEIIRTSILDCQQTANEGKFKLRDLLAVPMQRVLKYPLLLTELMKHIDKTSPEHKEVGKALEAMRDLSLFVNEVKRDREALDLIAEIQSSIVDLAMPENTELKDYGHLLKDGELKVRCHDDSREIKRYIFLFDKVMLMCKPRGDTYSYKSAYVLHQYKVEDGVPGPLKVPWRHTFMLVEKDNKTAITFFCKSDEMKKKWIEAINMAQDNFCPPKSKENGHEFVMHTFTLPTDCSNCSKLLRGCFYQGYICSHTKKKAHKECIPALVSANGPVRGRYKAVRAYGGNPAPPNGHNVVVFKEGDLIEVLNTENPNWWQGQTINREVGYFPPAFVSAITAQRSERRHQTPSIVSVREPSRESQDPVVPEPDSAYVNLDLNSFSWFVGVCSREEAAQLLAGLENGTFLVRESKDQRQTFAISVAYSFDPSARGSAKHVKIHCRDGMYLIADCKLFPNLPALVQYYEQYTLETSFPELPTRLLIPYKESALRRNTRPVFEFPSQPTERRASRPSPRARNSVTHSTISPKSFTKASQPTPSRVSVHSTSISPSVQRRSLPAIIGYATVSYDYSSTEPNQISLRCDEKVAIISKAGGDKGWWKGAVLEQSTGTLGKVGYFPLAYVEEDDPPT